MINNRKVFTGIFFLFLLTTANAQNENRESLIKQMDWKADYSIELTLKNDSIYIYDVENLHHTNANNNTQFNNFTYYPVRMSESFINKLKKRGVELGIDTTKEDSAQKIKEMPEDKTLWSALHSYIGGGFVHFVNTLLYSIESGYTNIRSPWMQRPETKWKPDNPSDAYERTKRWDYYAPVNQRRAIREYKERKKNNNLGDLKYLPDQFVELFLNTNNREYKKMLENNEKRKIARIDLIKLLLGANYLGKRQIKDIKQGVLKAVMKYSKHRLPSVIIFDNYQAAVALSLDETGYHIEKIQFADADKASLYTLEIRKKTIKGIIDNINDVNKELFQERLKNYYQN